MKYLTSLILIILIIFTLSGCGKEQTSSERAPITINLPEDNSVNGYRNDKFQTVNDITTDNVTVNETVEKYSLWGNENSKRYHKISCRYYKKTTKENIIYYKTNKEFEENGYSACKFCKP